MFQPAIFVALKPNTNINASDAHDALTHVIYTLRNCASFANLVVEAAEYPSRAFSNSVRSGYLSSGNKLSLVALVRAALLAGCVHERLRPRFSDSYLQSYCTITRVLGDASSMDLDQDTTIVAIEFGMRPERYAA